MSWKRKLDGWLKLTVYSKQYIVNPTVMRTMMSHVANDDNLRLDILLGTNNGCKNVN